MIIPALESVTLESIQKHFGKVRHYRFAYLEGLPGGSDLEKLVKKYKYVSFSITSFKVFCKKAVA